MISDRWMVFHVQSTVGTVTATHLVVSELSENIGGKQKKTRRSQSIRTRSCKQACRLANIIQHSEVQNQQENEKTQKQLKIYGAIPIFASPVLTSIKKIRTTTVMVS